MCPGAPTAVGWPAVRLKHPIPCACPKPSSSACQPMHGSRPEFQVRMRPNSHLEPGPAHGPPVRNLMALVLIGPKCPAWQGPASPARPRRVLVRGRHCVSPAAKAAGPRSNWRPRPPILPARAPFLRRAGLPSPMDRAPCSGASWPAVRVLRRTAPAPIPAWRAHSGAFQMAVTGCSGSRHGSCGRGNQAPCPQEFQQSRCQNGIVLFELTHDLSAFASL